MSDSVSPTGRWFATLVAAVSLVSLVMQYVIFVSATWDTTGPAFTTLRYFSYFTILANILVVLVTGTAAMGSDSALARWFARPRVRGGIALYIGVSGIIFVTILRHLWQPQGAQWWADSGLHYATPLLYLAWWLFAVGHRRLVWRDIGAWLLFPLGYVLWTFLRGQWVGEYPYPFVDVGALGMSTVLRNAAGMLGLFVAAGAVLVMLDRLLSRRQPT